MNTLEAWLCLKSAPKIKIGAIHAILEKYPDPGEFVGAKDHPLQADESLDPQTREHLANAVPHPDLDTILELSSRYDIKATFFGAEDYPEGLHYITMPPLILYYRGELEPAVDEICLGVVGTRKATAYGKASCKKLLEPVCRLGATIVSGLATGIDTAAHTAALNVGGKTIAVLASGLQTIYPPQNQKLAETIIANGALVSEYEPGTPIEPWQFVTRNRIISGLSTAVFIVEGSHKSGAMITAKHAIDQNREIMALPGPINHPNSQGPNYLIKNGALCVTEADDIIQVLDLDPQSDDQLDILPPMSPSEQQVHHIFQTQQREISFDELLMLTKFSFGQLSTALLNLELKGYLCKTGGNSFILS